MPSEKVAAWREDSSFLPGAEHTVAMVVRLAAEGDSLDQILVRGRMNSTAQELFDAAFAKPRDTRSAEYKQGVLDVLRHRLCEPNPDFKRLCASPQYARRPLAGLSQGAKTFRSDTVAWVTALHVFSLTSCYLSRAQRVIIASVFSRCE